VEVTDASDRIERASLIVGAAPGIGKPGEVAFDLHATPPTDRLNLVLPELNTVIDAEILARADPRDPWQPVTRGGFYRLQSADGELRNGAMKIDLTPFRYWLVRVLRPTSSAGSSAPRLEVQWRASNMLFLARGARPYTMAYGADQPWVLRLSGLAAKQRGATDGNARLARDPRWRVTAEGISGARWLAEHHSLDHADRRSGRARLDGLPPDEGTEAAR